MDSNFGWNQIARIYDLFIGKVDEKLYEEIIFSLGNLEKISIDEFGCGTGNLTKRFPESADIRAIDYSPNAIRIAKQKTNGKANFYLMDFYKECPHGNADVVVACRSIYHWDLSKSMDILAGHLNENGMAVIVHPHEKLKNYLNPKFNGKDSVYFLHLAKSINRLAAQTGIVSYSLFPAEEFEKRGREHFKEIEVKLAGYETHYLVKLRK